MDSIKNRTRYVTAPCEEQLGASFEVINRPLSLPRQSINISAHDSVLQTVSDHSESEMHRTFNSATANQGNLGGVQSTLPGQAQQGALTGELHT